MTWDTVTQAIFGLDADVPARRDTLLQLVHEDDRAMVEAALQDCMQQGTALALTFRTRRHGGIAHVVARGPRCATTRAGSPVSPARSST